MAGKGSMIRPEDAMGIIDALWGTIEKINALRSNEGNESDDHDCMAIFSESEKALKAVEELTYKANWMKSHRYAAPSQEQSPSDRI